MTIDWPILEDMPDCWKVDKTAGSPVHGCVFVTDGKSVLRGQKRALLRVHHPAEQEAGTVPCAQQAQPPSTLPAAKPTPHPDAPQAANKLARERMKLKILADVRVDLEICKIEGWSQQEYIQELKDLINSIGDTSSESTQPANLSNFP